VLGSSVRVLLLRRDGGLVALRGSDITGVEVVGPVEPVATGWAVAALAMSAAITFIARLHGQVVVHAEAEDLHVRGEEIAVGDGVIVLAPPTSRACFAVRLAAVTRVEGYRA
jgi:hypothetical protein